MEDLERQYALVFKDIDATSDVQISQIFHDKVMKRASSILAEIEADRSKLRDKCQRKRQDLARYSKDLDMDIGTLPDISPPYAPLCKELDRRIDEYQTLLNDREAKLTQLFDQCVALSTVVGQEPPSLPANYSLTAIQTLQNSLVDLKSEYDRRLVRLGQLVEQLHLLYEQLEVSGVASRWTEDINKHLLDDDFVHMENEIKQLELEKLAREAQIRELEDKISSLAEFIDASPTFSDSLHASYIDELKGFLEKYTQAYQEKIQALIEKAKTAYHEQCKHLGYTPREFIATSRETYEELKSENKRLAQLVEERQRIDVLIAEYERLKSDEKELELAALNPARLKQRGSGLVEEGKRRNRVMIRKPRILQLLGKLLTQWQQLHKEPFLVNGEEYQKVLAVDTAYDRKTSCRDSGRRVARHTTQPSKLQSKNLETRTQPSRVEPVELRGRIASTNRASRVRKPPQNSRQNGLLNPIVKQISPPTQQYGAPISNARQAPAAAARQESTSRQAHQAATMRVQKPRRTIREHSTQKATTSPTSLASARSSRPGSTCAPYPANKSISARLASNTPAAEKYTIPDVLSSLDANASAITPSPSVDKRTERVVPTANYDPNMSFDPNFSIVSDCERTNTHEKSAYLEWRNNAIERAKRENKN